MKLKTSHFLRNVRKELLFLYNLTKLIIIFFSSFSLVFIFEFVITQKFESLSDLPFYVYLKTSLFLALIILLLPKNKIRTYFFTLFYTLLFPFNFIQIEHLILFGTKLSYSSSLTMFNTDSQMIITFFEHFLGWKTFGGILLSLFPFIWIPTINVPYQIHIFYTPSKSSKNFYIPIASWLLIFYMTFFYIKNNIKEYPFYNKNLITSYKDLKDFENRVHLIKNFPLVNVVVQPSDEQQIHVVIIGESVKREEMSLYGSIIQTTPFLDSIQESLYIFDNVTSWSAQTAPMMEKLLSLSETSHDRNKMWEEPGLIDFYNAAGFETYWISGHSMFGVFDNYSHLLKHAKHKTFINKYTNWKDGFKKHKLDEALLPAIGKALEDPFQKKVIFIHLMGSHIRYRDRYPDHYQKYNHEFTMLENSANPRYIEYIKSIHYTDWILSKIFKLVQKNKKASSFILYFSDHAEGVSLLNACFCHADAKKDPEQLEIPFLLWLSDTYKQENNDYVQHFKNYLHRSYETNTWIHSLLDLSRISHPKIISQKSIFNTSYQPPQKRRYEEWIELKFKR